VISGEFNSQGVASTLWAFVKMGTKPGERLMGQLGAAGGGNITGVQLAGHYKRAVSKLLLPHTVSSFASAQWFLVFQYSINGF
jgi:hypothetical protein